MGFLINIMIGLIGYYILGFVVAFVIAYGILALIGMFIDKK